ncbi:unnamed protein product [Oppiella nova]|uniref:Insulin-like domain-containing protein n=1 Tax=Oppiella nova TaxID=334625 RepID=A0A7R9LA89_9ACAR|nr:unnamed protein product [Oppiella nova]CAG2161517.1 unnamed protein product [Oppiella nova]
MLFPFKSMSKNDRRVCRQKSGETERKRNIQQLVGICCQEACSLQTLTKYCRPGSVSSPGTWPSSEGVPNTMLVDDRDDIFKLRLPLFRPPENVGQYVKK